MLTLQAGPLLSSRAERQGTESPYRFFILRAGPRGEPCPMNLVCWSAQENFYVRGFCTSGLCLPGGEEVGQGVWLGEPLSSGWVMGRSKDLDIRYLLSLGGPEKVAAGGHLLSLEKPASTWRPEPARRGRGNHAAAPAADRQLPAQKVGAISGEVPGRQGAVPFFSLKGAPRASGAGGRSKAPLLSVRPPAPALAV